MTTYFYSIEMVSIIIPVFNEASTLKQTLERVADNPYPHEVIVVDGGSTDRTVQIARWAGAKVIESGRRQRAAQMNLGAARAQGDALLFLHADTLLPITGLETIALTLQDERISGGAFFRRFQQPFPLLRATCLLADWRNRLLGWHLGDQGIFARRQAFETLGGYRDINLFEDLDLSRRLNLVGRVVTLRPPVVSSARRFIRRGAWRTTASDFWLTCRYCCGADPNLLSEELRASRG